jgi:hypothetical protein
MINRLVLLPLIAGCLVFGGIVFMELAPAGDPATTEVAKRLDAAPAIQRQQNPKLDQLLAAILARPLFSSTRRPPEVAPAAAAGSDLADARLTGIVTEPGHRIAIFAVNGAKPLKLAVGEAVSGWRIESILPGEVSLSGPAGTKTTLQPKFDPSLVPPPRQPPPGNTGGRFPIPAAPTAGTRSAALLPGTAALGQPNPAVPINRPGTPPRQQVIGAEPR